MKRVYAKVSSTNYNAAAMDGILVQGIRYHRGLQNPIPRYWKRARISFTLIQEASYGSTYDAVIMIEDVIELGGKVQILKGCPSLAAY